MMSNYRQEDSATEERIAQILSDAQVAMQAKHSQEKVGVETMGKFTNIWCCGYVLCESYLSI